jgi:hypothetical protein
MRGAVCAACAITEVAENWLAGILLASVQSEKETTMPLRDTRFGEQQREARWGAHLFEVRVSTQVDPRGVLYVVADSVVTPPSGALILSLEVPPLEEMAEEPDEQQEPSGQIEMDPALIVAPGQWYSVTQVADAKHDHAPMYFEGGWMDQGLDDDE